MVKCNCDGFTDAWTYYRGHTTRTIHEADCHNNPDNWDTPDTPEE